jgi:predicted ATPase/DNA-binding SARP family transcriptional activator
VSSVTTAAEGRSVGEYRALGMVGVTVGTAFQPLEGRLGLLLSVLLTHVNQQVSTDFLIESVWNGTGSANPRGSLQVAINRLRHVIEPDRSGKWQDLVSVGNGYRLAVDDSRYDVLAFEDDLRTARTARASGDIARAHTRLEQALARWHGQAFGEYFEAPAVRGEAARLDELRLTAEDDLVDVVLELGEHHRSIPMISRHVDAEPLRERRWAQLMLALFRSNRQAEALRTYQGLRHTLSEQLGIEPSGDLQALEEAILLQDESLLLRPAVTVSPSGEWVFPQFPTQFVGRKSELTEVRTALERSRLVSLVGIGGVGKTRLAVKAAHDVCREMAHDCVYADLSELVSEQPLDPYLVDRAGGQLEPAKSNRQTLLDILRPRETLFVLDNVESMVESIRSLVTDVLKACPQVKVLITSRVPIRLSGEVVYRVPPLELPEDHGTPSTDALALLLDRAHTDKVESAAEADLRELCLATGGLPLAIELAASMLDSVTAGELSQRLKKDVSAWNPTSLATDERRSLRSVVGWSIERLSDEEVGALETVSIFRGGVTLSAAEFVGRRAHNLAVGSMQSHLRSLVDLGLIRFSSTHGGRYSILEPVRQFVQERMDPAVMDRLVAAHTGYFCQLAQEARMVFETISSDQDRLYLALERETANFRAMLESGLERADPTVLVALPGLVLFWYRRGGVAEGAEWTSRALDRFEPLAEEHIEALLFSAHIAMWNGEPKTALDRLGRFDERISRFGDTPLLSRALQLRGNVLAWGLGRPAEAVPHFTRAVEVARAIGYPAGLISLLSAAHSLVKTGRSELARDLLDVVPELATLTSVATGVDGKVFADVGTDHVLGLIDLYEGSAEKAEPRLSRSYETMMRLGLPTVAAHILIPVGWARLFIGRHDEANDAALKAREMITRETGGFRIAEALCLLGGLAVERDELQQASRWFALALGRAMKGPETDLVALALAGLSAVSHRLDDQARASRYGAYARQLMRETSLCLPKSLTSRWGLDEITIDTEEDFDPNQALTMAKLACDLTWEELL